MSITINGIVKDFKNIFSELVQDMSFVRYAGDNCIDVFFTDDSRMRYFYDEHRVIEFEEHTQWMECYENAMYPLSEEHYILLNSELIQGRMDALGISRKELAQKAAISERGLYKILRGRGTASSYTLYILEFVLQNSRNDRWHLL